MVLAIVIIIVFFAALSYLAMLCFFIAGWHTLNRQKPANSTPTHFPYISVVIAARNEEKTIAGLLNSLLRQDYPPQRFEVIIADDFSADNTPMVINDFITKHSLPNFFCFRMEELAMAGKKGALAKGIELATGEIIVTTDADCTFGTKWLSTLAMAFIEKAPEMVIGPVDIETDNSLFSKFQSLEFMSLTGSTGATAAWGMPVMCNGANLAFRKATYHNAKSTLSGKTYPSGDDVFLLIAFKKICPDKIIFLKNREALVKTKSLKGIHSFMNQRLRWASKAGGYNDFAMIAIGLIVAKFNILLVVAILFSLMSIIPAWIPVFLWLVKFVADFPLLYNVSRFMGRVSVIQYYLPLQIIYPFYVAGILIGSRLWHYTWKNRKIAPQ